MLLFLSLVVCTLCCIYFLLLRRRKPSYDEIAVKRCMAQLRAWSSALKLPIDHNFEHFYKVFQHALRAIQDIPREIQLSSAQITSILLAALTHDVDDKKLKLPPCGDIFPTKHSRSNYYPNAYDILMKSGCEKYVDLVLEMISLVSCSANGNRDVLPQGEKWKYIPRECDRLEALGMIGVCRVATGTFRSGLPFRTLDTPLPLTVEGCHAILQQRPLEKYLERKGQSDSMLDHFYDKLLHLYVVLSENPYIEKENRKQMAEMYRWLLQVNYVLHLEDVFTYPHKDVELEFPFDTLPLFTRNTNK